MKLRIHLSILLALIGVFSGLAIAQQDSGTLSGLVKDPNGAIVPGATVTVTSKKTNVAKTTTTNDDGYYIVTNLSPDAYTVTVSGKGFTDTKVDAAVSVSGTTNLNVTAGVAATAVTVDVAAGNGGVAEINTSDGVQSTIVNQRQISSLPTLDRNPYALVQLAGGVAPPSDTQGRGAGGFNINGQRAASTNVLLDGTENTATFTASIAQTVPQDSVEEFRVITNNFSAEFGRASGGIVNLVTKSGGNRFQGSTFEENRNSGLSSNTFDNNAHGIPRPNFNRNQFGYTVSGPIKKDKLFFLNSGEWTRVRSTGPVRAAVPSGGCIAAMTPNAKAFFASATLAATPTGVTDNINGCVFNEVLYSAPIDAGGGVPQNTYNNVSRVDWNISNATSAYFSYKIENDGFLPGSRFNSPYAGYNTTLTNKNQNVQGSFVHTFTSSLIFDGKVAFRNLKATPTFGAVDPNTPTLYASTSTAVGGDCIQANGCTGVLGIDPIAFPGYIPFNPGFGYDSAENEKLWDIKPNLTWIRGSHTLRFGGQYVHLQDASHFGAFQNASETVGSSLDTAVTALLTTGVLRTFKVAVDPQGQLPGGTVSLPVTAPNFLRTNLYNEWAIYANDQWKVKRTLTLNLGVRYEYYGAQHSKEGQDANFYFGAGNIFQAIRTGDLAVATTKGGLWKPGKNWAPRLGFAWDVFGNGKTSIRGGYGIAYERNFGNVTFNVIQNPPFYATLSVSNTPITTSNFGPLAGSSGTKTLPAVTLRAVDPNIKNAYAHQWGVSIEHQIARDTVAKIEYSGSAGRRLYSVANINPRFSGDVYLGSNDTTRTCPTSGDPTRLNCRYGDINFRGSDGISNYQGVTGSIESNDLLHTGLVTTIRYTYSVAKDDLSSTFSDGASGNFQLGYLDPFNPRLDYGYSDFDVRHRLVASAIYPISHKFTNRYANDALGGWNVSGILTVGSGSPFSVYDCTNAFSQCGRMVTGGQITFNGTRVQNGANNYTFIDLSKANILPGTDPGGDNDTGPFPSNMSQRNSFRSPGFWTFDGSVFKNIGISERYKLQLRLDAFNVFNHANLVVNSGGADVSSGSVSAFFLGNRNVQASIKLFF